MKKKLTKKEVTREIFDVLLIILGCAVLAFGSAVFLVPFDIVKGGMTSVAMMINIPIEAATGREWTDIFVWIFNILLWIMGYFVLSKEFARKTLVGSIFYPIFLTLFMRLDLVDKMGLMTFYESGDSLSRLCLFGLAGGVISGIGSSLSFLGKGSTGGSDVIAFTLTKYTDLKEDQASLIIDSLIILCGLFVMQDWGAFLVGILAAFASSVTVKSLYVKTTKVYRFEIVTEKPEEIRSFLSKEFNKTCTLFNVKGGYSGEDKKLLSVLLTYHEMNIFRSILGNLDPNAFVTIDEVNEVTGGAFSPNHVSRKEREKLKEIYGIEVEDERKSKKKEKAE